MEKTESEAIKKYKEHKKEVENEYKQEQERKNKDYALLEEAKRNFEIRNKSKLIKEVADKESCVIIGRCANSILEDLPNVVKVFIYSDMNNKVKRAVDIYGIQENRAEKEIKRIDKLRANHYKYYTEREWKDYNNYDICLNSDVLGVEKTAELVCDIVKEKEMMLNNS